VVTPCFVTENAYPYPAVKVDPSYLVVPAKLAGAVSNWVAGCEGLADARSVRESLQRVERHFATNFVYRLGLQMRLTPDPLVDFMERREGSCTFFASAAALMLRSCRVPSRVVSGYVCSGWDAWLKQWIVRERDGHAWVEAWDADTGRWLLVDPTPPDGNPALLAQPGLARRTFDRLVIAWNRFVVGLKGADFLAVIADVGETVIHFLWQVVWSPAGMAVWVGFAGVWWLRRRARRRAVLTVDRLREELTEAMCGVVSRAVPSRMRRRVSESWDEWLLRVGPTLPASIAGEVRRLTEDYQKVRYRVTLDEAEARRWIERSRHALRGAEDEGDLSRR